MMNGKWDRVEENPGRMEESILRGLIAQMKEDGRLCDGGIGSGICEENVRWDDISGEELNGEMVRDARTEEMMEVEKHKVYTKVPVSECWEKTGKA